VAAFTCRAPTVAVRAARSFCDGTIHPDGMSPVGGSEHDEGTDNRRLRLRSKIRILMSNSTSRPSFGVNRNLLGAGVVLVCVGGVVWVIGAALAGTALAQAAKKWVDQLDESPAEMANMRIQQLKGAVSAGSKAWREQTH
jgi:hypothetical protein